MRQIISRFKYDGEPVCCTPYGNGHINTTFKVECKNGCRSTLYILQQINNKIFTNIDALMENIEKVTSFLKTKICKRNGDVLSETLYIVKSKDGKNYYIDADGKVWRSYIFIANAVCYERIENPEDFYNCGYAFGNFQNLLADFPVEKLYETIPNFHNTPMRYEAFKKAVDNDVRGRAGAVQKEIEFVNARAKEMSALTDLLKNGDIPLRVTHNDTKLNNCMFDRESGKTICVIDLDTVMSGLRAYDYGDSIRFGASTGAEDEPDLNKVNFSFPLFESYTKGFLDACSESMDEREAISLAIGAKLMTLECGMRFLTDYLDGDTYFKISRENHNLDRCRTQFKLVSDMEKQWDRINEFVILEFKKSEKNY